MLERLSLCCDDFSWLTSWVVILFSHPPTLILVPNNGNLCHLVISVIFCVERTRANSNDEIWSQVKGTSTYYKMAFTGVSFLRPFYRQNVGYKCIT